MIIKYIRTQVRRLYLIQIQRRSIKERIIFERIRKNCNYGGRYTH